MNDSTIEIERKFLVQRIPDGIERDGHARITQGYITSGGGCREVRIRRMDDMFILGVKSGDGVEREETEVELDRSQFDILWKLTAGRRIEKRRYVIPYGDFRIELDVYTGALSGLTVAEVEFDSMEACDVFEPPEWFGREISDDVMYKNSYLAKNGLPDHTTE